MEKLLGNNYNSHLKSQNKPSKANKKPIKIKYISSPMMVQANNASEFRAIVQELTGQNSNVTELSEDIVNSDHLYYNNSTTGEYLGQSQPTWFPNNSTTYYDHQDEGDHYDQKVLVDQYPTKIVDDRDQEFSSTNGTTSTTHASSLGQFEEGQFWRSDVVSESFHSGFQYPCVFV